MQIGSLRSRIIIQTRDTGTDDAGQPLLTWTDFATVWADVRSPTGLAAIRDMQGDLSASVVQYSIRIRYRTDLREDMRVLFGTQVFDIQGILPDYAGKQYTDLVCTRGGTNG